jgi:hypothetical protein
VAQILEALAIPLSNLFALKFFCLVPLFFAQIFLLRILNWQMEGKDFGERFGVLLLAALNPARLFDGPVWGQLDLLAPGFVVFSLVLAFSERGKKFSFAVFVFALLIKFQSIAFLPVLAGIWLAQLWEKRNGALQSALWAALVFALVCLPFALSGNLFATLQGAYFNTVGSYAVATSFANNLWMMLVGTGVSDTERLVSWLPLSIRGLAFALFGAVSALVFWKSLGTKTLERATWLAVASGAAFFFLLPQMHERYLVQTIPFLLLLLALQFKTWPWLFLCSLFCIVNMLQNHQFAENRSRLFSGLAVLFFLALVVAALFPQGWRRIQRIAQNAALPFWLPEAMLALACVGTSFYAWSMQ